MKILILNGSPRTSGATGKILSYMADSFTTYADTEVQLVQLRMLSFDFCSGCSQCFTKGTCYLKDDAELLSIQLATANVVIIGSPTYESSMSGQLKSLIDRCHFVVEQLMVGKQTFSLATYENANGKKVMQSLNTLFLYSGGIITSGLAVKNAFGKNPLDDIKLQKKLQKKVHTIYKKAQNRNKNTLANSFIHWVVFTIGIKPFVLKKGKKYDGVLQHWKDRNITY